MDIQNVRYGYCLDENDNLVCIDSVTKENRYSHEFRCLQCGQKMIPKIGPKRVRHFAHSADVDCNGESYLHKLAKRRIREKFLSSENFSIIFNRPAPCCEKEHCIYAVPENEEIYLGHSCSINVDIPMDLKIWNGYKLFDKCEEEVTIGNFRADLLLRNSNNLTLPPVFIEVKVTHESTEEKLASEYRIIETRTISSEKDIEDIVSNGFVEGINCSTYNFNPPPPEPVPPIGGKPITRFVLRRGGFAKIYRDIDMVVTCDKMNQKCDKYSIKELNYKYGGVEIWGMNNDVKNLSSYQTCLLYLYKKGYDIKNCILCKHRKYNDYYDKFICVLYKTLDSPAFPKQIQAKTCPRFEMYSEWEDISIEELQKLVSEVPDDKNNNII